MMDIGPDELERMMADALTGRLSPEETEAFHAGLRRHPQLRERFEALRATAELLEAVYPLKELDRQTWLRIEKTLGWRRAGEGGSSRLGSSEKASKLAPLGRPDEETTVAGGLGAGRTARSSAAVSRAGARRGLFWAAMSLAAMLLLAVLATKLFPTGDSERAGDGATARGPDSPALMVRGARARVDDARGLALRRRIGAVAVYDAARKSWRGIVPGERVPYGAKVRTGPGARAELAFGESRLRLDEDTELSVRRAGSARVAALWHGRMLVDLLRAEGSFTIVSGGGSVELTGTVVEVDAPAPRVAFARVLVGRVKVTPRFAEDSSQAPIEAAAGQEVLVAYGAKEAVLEALPTPVKARAAALAREPGKTLAIPRSAPAWAAALDRPRSKIEAAVGQLVVKDEQGRLAEPLSVSRMHVAADIRGPMALTRIDQSFLNATDRTLEGAFYFPLPSGAAISRFAMYVDAEQKRLVEGEIVERGHARRVYESILRERRDPALLEWMGGNLFKARIFPIPPRSEKRVILEYTQLLPAQHETRRYVLPLVSELTQKSPIGALSIDVALETLDGAPLRDVFSPSYGKATRVEGAGEGRARASLKLEEFTPASDFVLSFSSPRKSDLVCAAYGEKGEAPYVLLGYRPSLDPEALSAGAMGAGRDVLFVVETGGTRTPDDLKAQRRALRAMVSGLSSDEDRVAIAAADLDLVPLIEGFVPTYSHRVGQALERLEGRAPLGALDLGRTLRGAAKFLARRQGAGRPRLVVFLGAGVPALGETNSAALAKACGAELARVKAKFVAVAVGRSVERVALSEIARRSGGFFFPLKPDEGLEEAAFTLSLSLQTPRIESPALQAEGGALEQLYPERLGSLLPGREIFLHARLKKGAPSPVKLALVGKLAGEPFAAKLLADLPADLAADPAVGRFWARARMDHLLARPRSARPRGEIVELAKVWTLMSPYTSFLVLESDADYTRYDIERGKRRKLWVERAPKEPAEAQAPAAEDAPKAQAPALRKLDAKEQAGAAKQKDVAQDLQARQHKAPAAGNGKSSNAVEQARRWQPPVIDRADAFRAKTRLERRTATRHAMAKKKTATKDKFGIGGAAPRADGKLEQDQGKQRRAEGEDAVEGKALKEEQKKSEAPAPESSAPETKTKREEAPAAPDAQPATDAKPAPPAEAPPADPAKSAAPFAEARQELRKAIPQAAQTLETEEAAGDHRAPGDAKDGEAKELKESLDKVAERLDDGVEQADAEEEEKDFARLRLPEGAAKTRIRALREADKSVRAEPMLDLAEETIRRVEANRSRIGRAQVELLRKVDELAAPDRELAQQNQAWAVEKSAKRDDLKNAIESGRKKAGAGLDDLRTLQNRMANVLTLADAPDKKRSRRGKAGQAGELGEKSPQDANAKDKLQKQPDGEAERRATRGDRPSEEALPGQGRRKPQPSANTGAAPPRRPSKSNALVPEPSTGARPAKPAAPAAGEVAKKPAAANIMVPKVPAPRPAPTPKATAPAKPVRARKDAESEAFAAAAPSIGAARDAGPVYNGFLGHFHETRTAEADASKRAGPSGGKESKDRSVAGDRRFTGHLPGGGGRAGGGRMRPSAKGAEAREVGVRLFWTVVRRERSGLEQAGLPARLKLLSARIDADPKNIEPRLERAAILVVPFGDARAAPSGAKRALFWDLLGEDCGRAFRAPDSGGERGEALREALSAAPALTWNERRGLLMLQPPSHRRTGDWLRLAALQPATKEGRGEALAFQSKALDAWKRMNPGKPLPLNSAMTAAALALRLDDIERARAATALALFGPNANDAKALAQVAALEARLGLADAAREHTLQALGTTPRDPAHAAARLTLYRNLAALSEGGAAYRVLADGLAEFEYRGGAAEALALDFARRVSRETSAKALEEALRAVKDPGLRARVFARRAQLQKGAAKKSELWRRAFEASGEEVGYVRPFVESLLGAKKDKAAVELLERKLREGLSLPWMWSRLAELYRRSGDTQSARRALTQGVAMRPGEPGPRRALAKALEAMGLRGEAVRELKAACELAPGLAAVHRELLALARRHKDRGAEAWVLRAMLDGTWLSEDGAMWDEAERGLRGLIERAAKEGRDGDAKDLKAQLAAGRVKDVEAVMSWDTDGTDVDLHVIEPGGHRVSYQSKTSFRGGVLDHDDTDGRGPETYTLKRASPGAYVIKVLYYGGKPPTQATVIVTRKKHSPEEKVQSFTVTLKKAKDEAEILRFDVPQPDANKSDVPKPDARK